MALPATLDRARRPQGIPITKKIGGNCNASIYTLYVSYTRYSRYTQYIIYTRYASYMRYVIYTLYIIYTRYAIVL